MDTIMNEIDIPCADGSDANCWRFVKVSLPYSALERFGCLVTVDESDQMVRIDPSDAWLAQFEDRLTQEDLASIKGFGNFERRFSDFDDTVCGACGSDQTYDAEGTNTSSD